MIEFDHPERPWKYMEEEDEYEGCSTSTDFESLITITRPYYIDPLNLDKRADAIIYVLHSPKANKKYNRNQAIRLANKCKKAGRSDLEKKIYESMP